ncbi:hypothetical protein BGZ51_005623 [Haplosporangium sp. Z 767]|nr:hypothetical protein BGZ50_000728 [Haplosporangium sp. Z 11]KAF9192429.1 hypothetical protein BGZ51_005623 [Haplosporangium sp. Z 767]
MNSQTAEMLKALENLRHIGADHIALPSKEQEKLDREWEYFETVCDQIFFILDNTKYKLKRRQEILAQQLNPPAPQMEPTPPEQIITDSAPIIDAPAVNETITPSVQAETSSETIPTTIVQPAITAASELNDGSGLDLQMLTPPVSFDDSMNPAAISTAALLSASALAPQPDVSLLNDPDMDGENKLQDTMLDLGDISNLGDSLGDMDDMINF